MTTPSPLEDKDAIRDLLYTYCFKMDSGAFDEWAELFAEDGVFVPLPDQEVAGRAAIRAFIGTVLSETGDGPTRKHLTINPVISIDGDKATALSNVLVALESGDGIAIALAGRYEDALVREQGTWRFQRRAVHFDIQGDLALKS